MDKPGAAWPLCYETNNFSPHLAEYFASPVARYPGLIAQLEAAAQAGFTLVGLDMGSIAGFLDSGGTLPALRAELQRLGLRCLEISEFSISADADASVAAAQTLLVIAEAVAAQFIQASVFAAPPAAAAAAARVDALLTGTGIALSLEYLPFSPLDSIAATRAFIDTAGLRNTRILVDTWHFFHGPDRWSDLEQLPGAEIAYIQFNDHPALQGTDLLFETVNRRCLPGAGRFELERFCNTVIASGFGGAVSLEVLSSSLRDGSPAAYAAAGYRAARRYWP